MSFFRRPDLDKFFNKILNSGFYAAIQTVWKSSISKISNIARSIVHSLKKYSVWKKSISKASDIGRSVVKHPVWSRVFRTSFLSTGIRQLSVLLLLGLFLTTGMIGNIEEATAETEETIASVVTAHRVLLNGKEAGLVSAPASALCIMDEVLKDAETLYGIEVSLKHKPVFEKVTVSPEQLSTKDELEEALRKYSEILVKAYALYADDEEIGIFKTEEDTEKLLDQVKAPYMDDAVDAAVDAAADDAVSDDAGSVEEVGFEEEIRVDTVYVPFAEIQSVEAVMAKVQEAQETVEEYTIKKGDTFWSIAKAYQVNYMELKEMNSDLDPDRLQLGQTIRLSYPKHLLNVVTSEIVEYEKSIPYQTETQKDSSMYTYQTKVVRQGKEGTAMVKARLIKVNGIQKEKEVLSEEVIKEPVNKIVKKGTKAAPASVSRGSGRLTWPTKGRLTSRFGKRWGRLHKGIDLANSKGTPIYAAESGKVIFTGRQGGYGNLIQIDHGGGMVTYYAHLSKIAVSKGKSVSRGQLIGYMGSTGNSTGSHLHFEVRINGNPKNPLSYLP